MGKSIGVEAVLVLHFQRVGYWRGHVGAGHSPGRTLILARLVELAFKRCVRPWRILAKCSRSEAGKIYQETFLEGLLERAQSRREESSVGESDELGGRS
jgi:hypothetical protein